MLRRFSIGAQDSVPPGLMAGCLVGFGSCEW
jgi:hypothetical protein